MGGPLAVISAVASVVGALSGIISALNPPKIHIPDVKLPEQDFSKIDAAIAANRALSDEARQAALNAIRLYNEGRLTPNYQAKLDEWWDEAKKQVDQRLAAAGLQNSYIALQAANELNKKYASLYTDLLRMQLNDALSLTGLPEQYIKDLMNSASLKLQGAQIEQQSALREAALMADIRAQQGKTLASSFTSLGQAAKDLGTAFSSIKTTEAPKLTPITSLGTRSPLESAFKFNPQTGRFERQNIFRQPELEWYKFPTTYTRKY
ncbi:MAG: hypothetical protein RMI01_09815 [Thermodesulfovibrio sp.]|nr:hypothetical protein [Thermodesulfovibrio sp.]